MWKKRTCPIPIKGEWIFYKTLLTSRVWPVNTLRVDMSSMCVAHATRDVSPSSHVPAGPVWNNLSHDGIILACTNVIHLSLPQCQVISVWVNFSFPVVVVMGTGALPPLLTVGGFNDSVNGSSSTVLAEYVEGSGTSQLMFEYTVSEVAILRHTICP